jgi:DNA polymerase-3 subunit epsilon
VKRRSHQLPAGRLAILDLETTGADPRDDRITEVGMLLVDDGEVIEEWSALVNPGRHISAGIEALTGITDRMVERAPPFASVAHDLAQRLSGRVVVAHNARFDYTFLRNELRRAGQVLANPMLCTVRLSRQLAPDEARHNLDTLIARHGLACDGRHRALPDARLVYRLLLALGEAAGADALTGAAAAVMVDPAAGSPLPPVLDDLPDTPGVYLLYEPDGAPLYAGKAANLRTQVLAHCAERGARGREQRAAIHAGAIEWTATAGELGAALRHLALVKRHEPRQNRRTREARGAWALRWQPHGEPQVVPVDLDAADLESMHDLYGPFRSRGDALAALRGLAREHSLCASLVGIGSGGACPPGSGCRGACVGRETKAAHLLRLVQALVRLRMKAWPFAGTVALVEEDRAQTRTDFHVLRDWRYLGSVRSAADLPALPVGVGKPPPFDVDVYRLLRRAVDDGARFRVIHLSDPGGQAAAR